MNLIYRVLRLNSIALCIYDSSILFAFKLLGSAIQSVSEQKSTFIIVWMIIFVFVSLQMTMSIRPVIGISENLLTAGKKIF